MSIFFLRILLFLLYSTFAYRLITPFTETVIKTSLFSISTELIQYFEFNFFFPLYGCLLLYSFAENVQFINISSRFFLFVF